MRHSFLVAATAAAVVGFGVAGASAQTHTFTFEGGTDEGWGTGFGNDASATYPIDNIGGSNRMRVTNTASFQDAGVEAGVTAPPTPPFPSFFAAMFAAAAAEATYEISYDWYVDTSLPTGGPPATFLQVATYVNTGSGYYAQDFPAVGKDVELNGTQMASGQVFQGTVTETFTAKGFDMPAGESFYRLGLIINTDQAVQVHFDNIRVGPVVPEPTTLALAGIGLGAVAVRRRNRRV